MRLKAGEIIPLVMLAVVGALFVLAACNLDRAGEKRGLPLEPSTAGERRIILLVADRLAYSDLRAGAGPVLSSLLERGAVALMNVRSGRPGSESGYLSLGAGARAVAGPEGNRAYNRGESADGNSAEVVFQRHNGGLPLGEVFHLYASSLQEKNSVLDYPVTVGLLGRLLEEENMTAAVVGNADAAGPGRGAVMIAMNPAGEVPLGDVDSDILVEDPHFPYGRRTDPVKLVSAVREYLGESHLVVVEFGDFSRLDQYWTQLAPAQRTAFLAATMARLDLLLEGLLPLVDESTILVMVTPSPPAGCAGGGEQLVPFLTTAAGPGLAVSSSTRRPGLVSNSDLLPLVISYLRGGERSAGDEQVIGVARMEKPLSALDRFSEQAALIFSLRSPVVKGYILAMIFTLLAGLAGMALKLAPVLRLAFVLEAIMLVPLVLLLLPGITRFPLPSQLLTGLVLSGATLLSALALQPLKKKERHLLWTVIGLATALVLVLDALTGSGLQQASFLGYDVIAGARYYGVGNEYMGALIGSAILGTVSLAALLEKGSPPGTGRAARLRPVSGLAAGYAAILLFYGLIIFILASPYFGANLGGTVSAAVAFGVAWAGLIGIMERRRRLAVTVFAFLLFALALLWALNMWWQPELPSHLGRFGAMVRSRGFEGLWETVWRKVNMNWKLVRYSIWSRAFVTLLGLFVVLSFYPTGVLRRLKREQPYLVIGAIAAIVGSAAALITNDSGIVAAATVLLFAIPPVLIPMMGEALRRDRG